MDERFLDENVRGGARSASTSAFSAIVADFAWMNGCENCPQKGIYRKHGVCWEAYSELLENYSMERDVATCCPRRA